MTMQTQHTPKQTLTVEEAAQILGIGRTLAYDLARSGQLPAIRLGSRLLISRAGIERLLEGESAVTDPPGMRGARGAK